MRTRSERYFRWLVGHRPIVLIGCSILLTVALVGALRVRVDYAIEQLFPARGEIRENFEQFRGAFSKEDTRFSLIWRDVRPPGVALFRDLRRAARHFEEVGLEDVDWIGSVSVAEAEELDGEMGLRVHPLIEESRLSDEYVRTVLARYKEDNLYRGYLWNAGQTAFAIHGYLGNGSTDDRSRREIEEALTARLQPLHTEGVTIALGGIPVIRSRLPKLLEADQKLFLGGGFVLFFALLFLFFRHPGQVVLCVATALPAYLVTIGFMGFAGISITVLTSFIPIIVLVVGVSDSIHLLARYRRGRRGGLSGRHAVVEAFAHLAMPCFYTSLTTAVGFASLIGTRIGIVMEFGAFTALAILLAFGFGMTFLPALLTLVPGRRLDDRGLSFRWLQRIVKWTEALALRPSRQLIAVFALVSAVGLTAGLTLRTNTLLLDDLRSRSGLIRDLRWIEAQGFGLFQVVLYLRQTDTRELHDPEALAWMARFQRFAERDPLVLGTLALPDFVRQLRSAVVEDGEGADGEGENGLPVSVEEASQLLFMASLEEPEFAEVVYHHSDGEAQVIVSVLDEGSTVILPFLERVDRYLAENPIPVGSAVPTGTVYLLQSYQARILESFGPSLAIALLLITGIMVYMFRSLRYGLLALIPNLFPLVVLMGVMRLCAFDLKPSTILVFSIAFGIAADDTIHFLGRFKMAIERGLLVSHALVESLRDAGPSILMTSLVVGSGFSLLIASQFEVLFLVGLMTSVSAAAAVCADLFAFPSILAVVWPALEGGRQRAGQLQETS
jgi:predicted RND superfamily exporter protein